MKDQMNLPDDIKSQFISNTASGNKQFDIPVTLYGMKVGNLKGFVYADGTLIDRHRRKTNLDLISSYEANNGNNKNHNYNPQKASHKWMHNFFHCIAIKRDTIFLIHFI